MCVCQLWPGLNSQESLLFYFSFEVNTLLFIHFDLSVVPRIYCICSQLCFSSHVVSSPYAAILSRVGLANFYSLFKSGFKCYLSWLAFPDIDHRLIFFPALSLYLLPPSPPPPPIFPLWQSWSSLAAARGRQSSWEGRFITMFKIIRSIYSKPYYSMCVLGSHPHHHRAC